MSKMVRKMPIDDFWNIGKSESWFTDMALQGLHLKKIGRLFVYFEEGEKTESNYRIDVLYEKPSKEQLDIYKEYGWEFVAKNGFFHVFSSPADLNFPALHTDPVEQGFTLDRLDKNLKKNMLVLGFTTLFLIAIIFAFHYFAEKPFLSIIHGDFIYFVFLVIVYFYITYAVGRQYIYVRKIRALLKNGIELNHNEDWKKRHLKDIVAGILVIALAGTTTLIPIRQMFKRDEYALPEVGTSLPIIRLADIEENSNLERQASYKDEGIDLGNNVRYEWSPLAPAMYKINESGIVEGLMWADKSGTYSPSLYTEYYQLAFEKLADGLLKDLMKGELYDPRYKEPKRIDNPKYDKLYVAENEFTKSQKLIFASKGKMVIYIRYNGNKEIEDILPLLHLLH